jgi:phosphatidylserine synthase
MRTAKTDRSFTQGKDSIWNVFICFALSFATRKKEKALSRTMTIIIIIIIIIIKPYFHLEKIKFRELVKRASRRK